MLSNRFVDDKRPAIKLNNIQLRARDRVEDKVASGKYAFEEVPCVTCQGTGFEKLAEKDRYGLSYHVVICKSCGLIQTNPRMVQAAYNDFYNTDYRQLYGGTETATEGFFKEQYQLGKAIYSYVNEYLPADKKWVVVEIGCGAGGILKYFQDRGHEVKGVDLGEEYIEYGKQQGLDLSAGMLNDLSLSKSPDLIIYSHVLEHILNPLEELQNIRKMAGPDTLIYIEVPGVKNLTKNYQMDFLRYLQNAHTYHFTLSSLKNLAGKAGLDFLQGDEQVRTIFKLGIAEPKSYKNDYQNVMSYLKRYEFLRKFYKLTPHFAGLVIKKKLLGK